MMYHIIYNTKWYNKQYFIWYDEWFIIWYLYDMINDKLYIYHIIYNKRYDGLWWDVYYMLFGGL
jgi:hypothetical protein